LSAALPCASQHINIGKRDICAGQSLRNVSGALTPSFIFGFDR
jgi:hypothetical protein